ncbi:thioredoxin-disulfide reductase [Spirochaetota bacterium]
MSNIYDVIIIGAGPAGLAAGIYAARAKLSTLILEKDSPGGQIVITEEVANYPGSVENATGPSLVARMLEQCREFGAEQKKEAVISVDFSGKLKKITSSAATYEAKAVIVAAGAIPRKICCPGENDFVGKGVSYCATCDADFFTDLEVFCIGGGDTALEEALYLSKFARKVSIVHRRNEFRAAKSIVDKVLKNPKISIIYDSIVEELKGDGILESLSLRNVKTNELTEYKAAECDGTFGCFVFIGSLPHSELFKNSLKLSDDGYICTDEDMKTNIPGVFAAGDIRVKSLRQVVTAASDGAIAAVQADKYIETAFN